MNSTKNRTLFCKKEVKFYHGLISLASTAVLIFIGVVVCGAKAHQTGICNSHEVIVMPTQSMGPDDKDYAVSFAVPLDTPGLFMIIGRQSCDTRKLEGSDIDVGNAQYGGVELLVVFADVFIPNENIYMNGAILGMTRAEVDSKIDQIIEFSECGDFIDTPVKRYSSGMFVKLAFSVAAHLDSEIMVMDEVLAVGDMKFQQKCLGKMSDVAGQEGRTVLYVSHNMSTIRQLCTRCVVLDQGRVIFDGDVEQAIAVYMETTDVNVVHYDLLDVSRMNASAGKRMRLETLDFVGKESSVFADTEKIRVRITWRVSEPFTGVHLKLNLHFRDSTPVGITHPVNLGAAVPGKLYTTEFEFDPSLLGEGQYFFYVDVFDGVLTQAVCLDKPVTEFAFEVTSGDLTMPEWAPGWGRIHFPPVKVLENGYDG